MVVVVICGIHGDEWSPEVAELSVFGGVLIGCSLGSSGTSGWVEGTVSPHLPFIGVKVGVSLRLSQCIGLHTPSHTIADYRASAHHRVCSHSPFSS